jgi:aldose 1-epimerase
VTSPSGEQYEIRHGAQVAVVVEVGAGLRSYTAGGRDVVDGYGPDETCSSGRGQVLIPWPNRLEDGTYEFDGQRHRLPLTEPENGNAIHGLVRWAPWAVTEREPHRVVLEHALRPQAGYPFSLALAIEYALSEEGLRVSTTATNVGTDACPYGSGAHPYLKLGAETVDDVLLRVPARAVLRLDDRGIPVGTASVEEAELDFRVARPVGATRLDHCFTDLERGPDGHARVELHSPEGVFLTLWVDGTYPYLMLFTGDPLPDVARRSLAVEPMTCAPNAFRSGDGLVTLEPGESIASSWGIVPSIWARLS